MSGLNRRDFMRGAAAVGACAGISGIFPQLCASEEGKYNVLFIAVDDLRPQLGCYGVANARTPNLDALAARGTLFDRAYCQQALCSPSRTSLLTGCRPDTTKIYNLEEHFRKYLPDVVTLPQQFKQCGYHSLGFSKIYHPGLDDPQSWSVPHWNPKAPTYVSPESLAEAKRLAEKLKAEGARYKEEVLETDPKTGMPMKIRRPGAKLKGPSWECADVPDNTYADGMTADQAVLALREVKDKRFFLAVGFHKPHLPFVAPKKYFDMHAGTKFTLADNPFPPKDCPEVALTTFGELRAYTDIPPVGPLDEKKALDLIRAYHAAASYTDAQIGKVLAELDKLGLRDKTIIVVWGDHGWHLGEHGLWCKHTNFEEATRAPLIFSVPGQKKRGAKTEALVEFVDIYPTLCDLAGLPIPKTCEGTSLAPIIRNPKASVKTAAFSQYPRAGGIMGYSARTDRYRYTEWRPKDKEPMGVELYDYKTDPKGNVSIAGLPGNRALVAELHKTLTDGWRAALKHGK